MKEKKWIPFVLLSSGAILLSLLTFALYRSTLPEPQAVEEEQQETQRTSIPPELETKLKILEDAIRANPQADSLVLEYANTLFDVGDYIQARQWYQYYLDHFDSLNADVRTDYAYTLIQTGKPMEGVAQLQRAIAIDSTHSIALFNLALLNAQIQRYEAAKQYLQKAIRFAKDSVIRLEAQKLLTQINQLENQQ